MTRLHNFVLTDAEACCVFMSESMKVAGVDNALKLTRLMLISLFLCFEGVVSLPPPPHPQATGESPEDKKPAVPAKKKNRGKKRVAAEISEAETGQETGGSSFEKGKIPAGTSAFQEKLFHLITVMVRELSRLCGEKEVAEAGKYLLADVTVGEDGAGEG